MVGENGTYSSSNYTKSFAGMAPYDDPQIVTLVVFQGEDNNTTDHQANVIKNIVPSALSVVSSYNSNDNVTEIKNYKLDSFVNQSVNFVKSKLQAKSIDVQAIGNGATVVEQFPKEKSKVTKGDRVFIKTESNDISIPDFTGWSSKDISIFGSLSGIMINVEGSGGFVIGQNIPPGTIMHSGDTLIITLG